MLAGRRYFFAGTDKAISTPLLVPSFSSKGFPDFKSIISYTLQVIDGSVLVSAYDLIHEDLTGSFDFRGAVFLDSGGYEASIDQELSEAYGKKYVPKEWSLELYQKAISGWSCGRPTVIIGYDHPLERLSLKKQIERAEENIPNGDNIFREILIKPSNKDKHLVDTKAVVKLVNKLQNFHAIGFTEKEIGENLLDRMRNISAVRRSLNKTGQSFKPIHIFGSLDPVSIPLYFVAGADIFDGLTWLRFGYYEGVAVYRENFAALGFGQGVPRLDLSPLAVKGVSWTENYRYLMQLQGEMHNFIQTQDFKSFQHHSKLIEQAYKSVDPEREV